MTTFTPTHAVIKAGTLSKWQLSRKLPGKFSLTVQRGHWLTRYVSQEAGFAIAEAWLHKLDSHAPDHWCLMDKHDHDHVFFMQVRSGVVREATTLKIDDINEELMLQGWANQPNKTVFKEIRSSIRRLEIDERAFYISFLD